ncbi:MAG TPA: bile acid:sodium symporter [Staphylococcus auricularis]|nr:bile acid:sodium symporter [Staphylococcus auricularis]
MNHMSFIGALLVSQFIVIPLFVFVLIHVLHINDLPILIGLYLVLLCPCIDYVIVFTHLGKGNATMMLMSTPLLFILQMVLLPLYFMMFLPTDAMRVIDFYPFIHTFVLIILVTVILAVVLQFLGRRSHQVNSLVGHSDWFPVPLMALILFTIISAHIHYIAQHLHIVAIVVLVYLIFVIIVPFIANLIGRLFRLAPVMRRTLIFSSSTRNALVVLPLAFALPGEWRIIASTVIVTQICVELIAELVYIKVIPKLLYK